MPSHVGVWELPRRSPCLLTVRRAVRAWWEGADAAGVAGGRGSVAVGVSGGADSLALLLGVLAEVGPDAGGVPVDAVVVNHGLQSGSGGVARRVAGVCEQLGGACCGVACCD
ncbi:ATP-binding protein [Corynebacterium argentoratense]|uniref:ATP-binding protein n=1 Tax=Corynebacterium argentoratense TaxID=42817 RepID=UPI0006975A2A|nr:ATP-binding protein [Corynebacterium argentoratense]